MTEIDNARKERIDWLYGELEELMSEAGERGMSGSDVLLTMRTFEWSIAEAVGSENGADAEQVMEVYDRLIAASRATEGASGAERAKSALDAGRDALNDR